MDFKTNQTFFLLLGQLFSFLILFGRGDGAISTKQSIVHEPQNYSMRNQRLVVIFRPDNLGDQI
jgi:hypothetical protein